MSSEVGKKAEITFKFFISKKEPVVCARSTEVALPGGSWIGPCPSSGDHILAQFGLNLG